MDPPGRNIRSDTNYSKWPQQGQAAHILHDSRPDAPTRSENERLYASMRKVLSLGIIQSVCGRRTESRAACPSQVGSRNGGYRRYPSYIPEANRQ